MLQRIAFVLVAAVAACGSKDKGTTAPTNTAGDGAHAPVTPVDPANESIGGIQIGDPESKVTQTLGAASAKGEVEEWAATGDRISMWTWDDKGATFAMSQATDGSFTVHSMSIAPPSTLTTSRGIGIGATFDAVDKTYGEFRGQGRQDEEPEQWSLEDGITVGSVYGGTMFAFEGGKVSSIFVGAAAE